MRYKGFIFDADGVVIPMDFYLAHLAQQENIPIESILTLFDDTTWKPIVTGKQDLKEVLPFFLQQWGVPMTPDELLQKWFTHEHQIDPQISNLIETLKENSYPCFLATNQEPYRFQYISKEMGFSNLFDKLYCSAELGFRKPDKKFYEYMLESIFNDYGISRNELLFIDDTLENVTSALSLGLPALHYQSYEHLCKYIKN